MTRIHLIIAAFAATAVGASPAFSAPLKEAGPWDLLLIQQKSPRYSAYLYPVTTPAECLASKRALGQVECIYR